MTSRFVTSRRGRVPVILVSGIDESAMATATISLQFGLADAVVVHHSIDVEAGTLTRIVSDLGGIVERHEIDLAHACVSCAVREDIVPTLERLAASGRWRTIVARLPVSAEAVQVCRTISWAPGNAPHVTIAAVVAALDATAPAKDLLGDDLLAERGLHSSEDDERGVGEVACAMVEYADAVCFTHEPSSAELALVAALVRPRAPVVTDPALLDAQRLAAGVHRHEDVESWVSEVRSGPLPPLTSDEAWRLDLTADRALHPSRLYDEMEALGSGPYRLRGCLWLPTRPRDVIAIDGAGGQVSVGTTRQWAPGQRPFTRIVITGLDEHPVEVVRAFGRCLLSDDELRASWDESWDGLEPWLGPIDRVA